MLLDTVALSGENSSELRTSGLWAGGTRKIRQSSDVGRDEVTSVGSAGSRLRTDAGEPQHTKSYQLHCASAARVRHPSRSSVSALMLCSLTTWTHFSSHVTEWQK